MNEEAIKQQLKSDGYDEVAIIEWDAGIFNDMHAHDFSASIHVLSGEMTVATAESERTCRAGDCGTVDAGTLHSERVGPDGVRFMVGKR